VSQASPALPPDGVPAGPSPIATPPAGRYGPVRGAGRRRAWLIPAVVLGTLAAVVFGWLAYGVTRDPVQWQDVGFSVDGPQRIDVTFEVIKSPGATVRCRIQALSKGFAEVGVQSVDVGPSADGVARFTVSIPTSELAVSGTVDGCVLVTAG